VKDGKGLNFSVKFDKSGFYGNGELSRMLSSGLHDFILIGEGIDIEIFQNPTGADELISEIQNRSANFTIDPEVVRRNTTFPMAVRDVTVLLRDNVLNIQISAVSFSGSTGTITNFSFSIPAIPYAGQKAGSLNNLSNNLLLHNSLPQNPAGDEVLYIRDIKNGMAEMIYQKGSLYITTHVKIRRKLEDGFYLVENITSRKTLRVRYIDTEN
jgi:hypothetical protein